MEFTHISSEQALAILSHFRAIAQLTGRKAEAFVRGDGHDERNEIAFLHQHYFRVEELPTRKYFRITLEDGAARIRFDDTLDLLVQFS